GVRLFAARSPETTCSAKQGCARAPALKSDRAPPPRADRQAARPRDRGSALAPKASASAGAKHGRQARLALSEGTAHLGADRESRRGRDREPHNGPSATMGRRRSAPAAIPAQAL